MPKTEPFDNYSDEYDNWFIINKYAFLSELNAVNRALPPKGNIIEIGIGSGIFAEPLGIKEGVEPSAAMRDKARGKGIKVIDATGEELPYTDKSKDAALMITTICFVDDVYKSFQEVYRVLKDDGHFIIGFVDKESPIGKLYLKEKDRSLFYKKATFFGTEELFEILKDTGFEVVDTFQTIFGRIDEIASKQKTLAGYGQGSFIVIKAQKK